MAICAALRRLWPNGRAQDTGQRYFRHEVLQLIAERETKAWERWPDENDREKAVKAGTDGNIRPDHPFLLALDRAFKVVFGDAEPRARQLKACARCWNVFVHIRGSQSASRPNGWWTTELDALA